jgi:hypothetical protein
MSFIQAITEFFESIFNSSSPEVRKRQELRKIEGELKNHPKEIFKNECLTPNFAELFRILYENTKPIDEILSTTVNTGNLQKDGMFEYQLILTGFTDDTQEKLESLSYEGRKKSIENSNNISLEFDKQRRAFEALLNQLNTPEFRKIDETMAKVKQLADICRYNYISVVRAFDPGFDGISQAALTNAREVRPEVVGSYLQDLYYLTANMSLNSAVMRAVLALKYLKTGKSLSNGETDSLVDNIKKINTVLLKILEPEILRKIICLAKKDPSFKPKIATYSTDSIRKFLDYAKGRFDSDENRIKTEIRDFTISAELRELFNENPLSQLQNYNSETNKLLREASPYSLEWITPLQTLKTFMEIYFNEPVKTVLNNILIEGFFNNPSYKTSYSSAVYACNDIMERLAEFEKSFDRGKENDMANILGLIDDSKRDSSFLKQLGNLVDKINNQAHEIIQAESRNIFTLYKQVGDLIVDAKKSKPTLIQNVKVLLSSTRNRDGSGILEQQHPAWKIFLKIMKNYAIIGELEDDNN